MTGSFSIGSDLWGYCGHSNGGWTMAIQGVLLTHFIDLGSYGTWGNGVDGYWGSGTDQGVEQWQDIHGLTVDGCVGSGTWNNSMAASNHRFYGGYLIGSDVWGIANHNSPSSSSYRETAFARPYGSTSVAVDIRYAGGTSQADPDCWWVRHDFTSHDDANTWCGS